MKRLPPYLLEVMLAAAISLPLASGQPAQPAGRVGVYDSRVIAYVQFSTQASRQQRDRQGAEALLAKETGHLALATRLSADLAADQARIHLEVFSTAPASEALAELQNRRPDLCAALGVTRLVSKWDDGALSQVPPGQRVDVTDALVHEFVAQPDAQLVAILHAIEAAKPVPLMEAKAQALIGIE